MKFPALLYEKHIDGLRAVAVLLVVANHLFPGWMPGGFIGVDIFFVISGYLISSKIFHELHMGEFKFADFYWRRAKRLIPALAVVLVGVVVLGWFVLFPDEYKSLAKHAIGGIVFASNFLMMHEAGYFDDAAITKPLMHLWSLGVEEQYYLVFPAIAAVLWITSFFRRNLLAIFLVITLLSFAFNVFQTFYNPSIAYYSPATRAWEFMVGVVFACTRRGQTERRQVTPTTWLGIHLGRVGRSVGGLSASLWGLVILGVALYAIRPSSNFPGALAALPVLAALFVIADQGTGPVKRWLFESKASVLVGKISYPLYLWHWPLISYANYLGTNGKAERIAILLASFLLAFLTWKYAELPLQRVFTFRPARPKVKSALVFSTAAVAVLACWIVLSGGFEGRSISKYAQNQKELIRTPSIDESCINNFSVKINYCRGSFDPAKETVAVIGDSHAHAAFPGIEHWLLEHHKSTILLANSGCPALIGAEYGRNDYEKNECKSKIEAINSFVLKHENVKTVLIFTRGATYIEPSQGVPGNEFSPPLIQADRFAAALARTTYDFVAAGKRVYYVIENPTLPFFPGECLARPFAISTKDCSQGAARVLQQQKHYREMLQGIPNLQLIDTVDAFCPNGTCLTSVDGRILYADQNHLSVWGSEFLARKVLAGYLK